MYLIRLKTAISILLSSQAYTVSNELSVVNMARIVITTIGSLGDLHPHNTV